MSAWQEITRNLHRAGGGPLPRSAFDAGCAFDISSALNAAHDIGVVICVGRNRHARWQLTRLGRDWCEGRVVLKRTRTDRDPGQIGRRRHVSVFAATWLRALPRAGEIQIAAKAGLV